MTNTVSSQSTGHRRLNPQPQSGVPNNLIYAGIFVGLLLVLFGTALLFQEKASLLSSLMTCVGFGIVLASFGSKAGGAWAGWTATGAGAMAIILFLISEQYRPASSFNPTRRGQIRGDLSKIADLRIIDDTPMYQFRDTTTGSIKFIILDRVLKSQRMSIQVDTTEKGQGREFFELIASSKLISERYLSDNHAGVIQWEFDYPQRVVKDGQLIIFAEADTFDANMLPRRQAGYFSPQFTLPLVGPASAQDLQPLVRPASSSVVTLVQNLQSDDATTRRNARDALVSSGAQVISPLMAALRRDPTNYRLKGGTVYILSTILHLRPDQKSSISAALEGDDFPILVAAASDDDKTISFQATEFLYMLGDRRSIPYSVNAARDTRDNNKASNLLSIVGQSSQQLSTSDKQHIIRDIQRGPGPNNDLVGSSSFLRHSLGLGDPQRPASSLLRRISEGKWCTAARSYSLTLDDPDNNLITWRDNLGNIDTETIVSDDANQARTVTTRSLHRDGKNQPIGQSWTYTAANQRIDVKPIGKNPFSLTKC